MIGQNCRAVCINKGGHRDAMKGVKRHTLGMRGMKYHTLGRPAWQATKPRAKLEAIHRIATVVSVYGEE